MSEVTTWSVRVTTPHKTIPLTYITLSFHQLPIVTGTNSQDRSACQSQTTPCLYSEETLRPPIQKILTRASRSSRTSNGAVALTTLLQVARYQVARGHLRPSFKDRHTCSFSQEVSAISGAGPLRLPEVSNGSLPFCHGEHIVVVTGRDFLQSSDRSLFPSTYLTRDIPFETPKTSDRHDHGALRLL